jgi:RNA polymerase sigma-70 factor (ECF subfamily)
MSEMDDAALLGRARKGDEAAFALLFATYQRQVFRYAAYMTGPDSADDIVQDTFLAVLRQKTRSDGPTGSLSGYLIGIARHFIMKRHARPSDWAVDDEAANAVASAEPSAFERMVVIESVDAVRSAVKSLPPAYREAVVLCELEDMDYAVAATLMQCPIGTVRSRLHRARALLAQKLSTADAGGRS